MTHLRSQVYGVLARHAGIIVVLFLGAVVRFYWAPLRSYWYDEFLSVFHHGSNHETVFAALNALARSSIHPPLYQFILYNWMELFGQTEIATRTLSNLYVVGATACLYLLVYKVYGRRVALGSALMFTLMYLPLRYGMEARSYAQTLFFACLSSLLLFRHVTKLPERCGWRELLLNWRFVWLSLANTALLLTHYYNVFFLAAQGLFLLIYFLLGHPRLGVLAATTKAFVVSLVPFGLLFLTWGWVMAHRYSVFDSRGTFHADFPAADPWTIFSRFVLGPTFSGANFAHLVPVIAAVALMGLIAQAAWELYRHDGRGISDRNQFTLYFVIWTIVPCIAAFLLFLIAQAERYHARYFIFCAPPLAVVIFLTLENLVRIANRAALPFKWLQPQKHYVRYALIYAIIAAAVIAMPGGRKAAAPAREDYRGIANMIANIVREDAEHRYILYEASRRKNLDYYLKRTGKETPRLAGNIIPDDERSPASSFDKDAANISCHDFLIVAFTHERLKDFPRTVEQLNEQYEIHAKILNRRGRGVIVYRTGSERSPDPSCAKDENVSPDNG